MTAIRMSPVSKATKANQSEGENAALNIASATSTAVKGTYTSASKPMYSNLIDAYVQQTQEGKRSQGCKSFSSEVQDTSAHGRQADQCPYFKHKLASTKEPTIVKRTNAPTSTPMHNNVIDET